MKAIVTESNGQVLVQVGEELYSFPSRDVFLKTAPDRIPTKDWDFKKAVDLGFGFAAGVAARYLQSKRKK